MLGILIKDGWTPIEDPEKASVIVVNTCSFIESAKIESVNHILDAARLKERNPAMKLLVTGCLPQRYQETLVPELPEVDLFIGTDEFPNIAILLKTLLKDTKNEDYEKLAAKRTQYIYGGDLPRINTQKPGSAYVKIAEGCEHRCSFCIIPEIRGPLRSRSISSIVSEVEELTSSGVIEINLIAQDLTAFGREKKDERESLPNLLRSLVKIHDLRWIRLLYAYPEHINDEFIEIFKNEPKIVKYLDIPIQHANNRILKDMGRGITAEALRETIQKVRSEIPRIALRTSVMVGFPGETDEEFIELRSFLVETRFEHLGCFTYSQEEGTRAATFPNQIDQKVKERRFAEIMKLQRKISKENLKRYLGQTLPVLVEGPHEDTPLLWQGRLETQAPEVDGSVIINDGTPKSGRIYQVKITETRDYDLIGEII